MPIKKGFNSEKAARKWERLTQLSEQSFATIASGEAEEKDFNDLVRVLSKQSSLAAQVFSQGISTIQASADDLAAIIKLNAKQKGKELTEKEFTQIQKQSFVQVFKSEVDSLATAIGRELAKTQPQVAEALKEFDTLSAKFDKLAEELKEKFTSTFQHARRISTRKRKSPTAQATKKEQYDDPDDFLNNRPNNLVASKWEKELQLELKKRSTPVISRWMNGIYSSVISKAQNVIKNTKDFYWAGLETYDKYDLEMEEAHLYNTRNRASTYFARTNADLKTSNPTAYSEQLQEYLTQVMEKQKAYLYNLKRDEPRKYAQLRKKYIKGNVKATIKYGFSTMSRLFKSLYSKFRATDTGSILKTIAGGVAAYYILKDSIIPNYVQPLWEDFKGEVSNWTSNLMPDIGKWTQEGSDYITTQYNSISSSLTGALDSAKGKWDETYNKYFGQEEGSGDSWYNDVWKIIQGFFDWKFIESIGKQVWGWVVDKVAGGVKALFAAIGADSLVSKVDNLAQKLKGQSTTSNTDNLTPTSGVPTDKSSSDFTTLLANHKVTSPYGPRISPKGKNGKKGSDYHPGIDLRFAENSQLMSLTDGVVTEVDAEGKGNGGKYVSIRDNEGFTHTYMHLNRVNVREGDKVQRGTLIALTGNTGTSTGPHLHYQIKKGDNAFYDPIVFWNNVKLRETQAQAQAQAKAQSADTPTPSPSSAVPASSNASSNPNAGNLSPGTQSMEKQISSSTDSIEDRFSLTKTVNSSSNNTPRFSLTRALSTTATRFDGVLAMQNVLNDF